MTETVTYMQILKQDIEVIRPVWEKLRRYHQTQSVNFKEFYDAFTFEVRTKKMLELPEDNLFVEAAVDVEGKAVGYCMSSASIDGVGELESIYVEVEFRKSGVGSRLVQNSIEWMKNRGCKKISVAVANGNEEAFPFYEKFGFRHRLTVLELKSEKGL
jgi:diamine N-acetyltransferase